MADVKKTTKAAPKKVAKKATEVKTLADLHEDLKTLRNDHQESRRSHRQGELVNPHVLTVQRKNIARTLTAIKQAEKSAQVSTKEEK
jgi:large subunit ribosomal protein L29